MYILQVFSPASVIFAGIGVFLAVRILSGSLLAKNSHVVYLIGRPGCCGE